jgi:uncharacterized protein (TIGR03437 family)
MKFPYLVIGVVAVACLRGQSMQSCKAVTPAPSPPPAWDTSGNSMLTGKTYFFRYVQYTVGDQYGNLSRAIALFQTITFHSDGLTYTINGTELDSNAAPNPNGIPPGSTFTGTGSFYISSSGFGYLTNPICPGDQIWGMVSPQNGVFAGSTTETQNGYNDLFIAAPVGSTPAGTSSLNGAYSVAYLNFPNGYVAGAIAAGFVMNANGQGSIGNVNVLAFQGANPAVTITENLTYSLSGGMGTLTFPSYFGDPIAGSEVLYASQDGSFIFGGSITGYDIFVGVNTGPGTSVTNPGGFNPGSEAFNFSGLYMQAGIDETMATVGGNVFGAMQSYYGAFDAVGGTIFGHQRIRAPLRAPSQNLGYPSQPFSNTYTDKYALAFNSNGGYTDTATQRQYVIGAQGTIRIGFGLSPALGISVAIQSPTPASGSSSTKPYINPDGVVNAASYAPFTTGISPGELIIIYGSNFISSAVAGTPPYLTSLNNVQVMINSTAAQIQYVYPGQIAAIVPANIQGLYAQIQVTGSGGPSNTVWALVNKTTPGVFTQTENGIGDALALDANMNWVNPSNPAMPNRAVSIFTTGLGAVATAAGILPGSNGTTPYMPMNTITATIGGIPAAVSFPNLSPVGSGLYQISVTVPAGVTGEAPLVISGPDAQTSEATICVASCPAPAPLAKGL